MLRINLKCQCKRWDVFGADDVLQHFPNNQILVKVQKRLPPQMLSSSFPLQKAASEFVCCLYHKVRVGRREWRNENHGLKVIVTKKVFFICGAIPAHYTGINCPERKRGKGFQSRKIATMDNTYWRLALLGRTVMLHSCCKNWNLKCHHLELFLSDYRFLNILRCFSFKRGKNYSKVTCELYSLLIDIFLPTTAHYMHHMLTLPTHWVCHNIFYGTFALSFADTEIAT